MPFDPFFSSKVKDTTQDEHDARKCYAKAVQFHTFIGQRIGKKNRATAIRRHQQFVTPARIFATKNKGCMHQCSGPGHPSLSGFKPPKKKWIHRNSQHPEG